MYLEYLDKALTIGSVGVIPTDTVYGLVARATDQGAVEKLYSLKKRNNKPGTIIAYSVDQLETLGLKHRYLEAVKQFWPGPVSVIIPVYDPKLDYLHLKLNSLAVRIPNDKSLLDFLDKTGPLLTTSANLPGQKTANDLVSAKAIFKNKVDYYIDGGNLSDHKPSTIVRIVDDAVEIIRPGAAKIINNDTIKSDDI